MQDVLGRAWSLYPFTGWKMIWMWDDGHLGWKIPWGRCGT